MKRAALVFALLCLRPQAAAAQQLGVEGGLTRAQLFSTEAWSAGSGFEIGGLVTFDVAKQVQIQTDALFVRKVTDATLTDANAQIHSTMTLDYVEVPVLVKGMFSPKGKVSPVVFVGFFSAYNIRAKAQSRIGTSVIDEDVKDVMNSWDYGFVVGAGVEFGRRGPRRWIASLRYDIGLPDVTKSTEALVGKTRTLGITAGIRWR